MIEDGREPPAPFFERPEISEWEAFYWRAFGDLSTERQVGMSLGSIPRSSILAYAAEQHLFEDAAEHFERIIRLVDDEYLSMMTSTKDDLHSANVTDIAGTRRVLDNLRARSKVKRGNA